jgi:hypothetical protein
MKLQTKIIIGLTALAALFIILFIIQRKEFNRVKSEKITWQNNYQTSIDSNRIIIDSLGCIIQSRPVILNQSELLSTRDKRIAELLKQVEYLAKEKIKFENLFSVELKAKNVLQGILDSSQFTFLNCIENDIITVLSDSLDTVRIKITPDYVITADYSINAKLYGAIYLQKQFRNNTAWTRSFICKWFPFIARRDWNPFTDLRTSNKNINLKNLFTIKIK